MIASSVSNHALTGETTMQEHTFRATALPKTYGDNKHMYETICIATKRTYNAAKHYIHEYTREADKPRIVHMRASDITPDYYSVMVRVRVTDRYSKRF